LRPDAYLYTALISFKISSQLWSKTKAAETMRFADMLWISDHFGRCCASYCRRWQEDSAKAGKAESLREWQSRWDTSEVGRWTHRLIPHVSRWISRERWTSILHSSSVDMAVLDNICAGLDMRAHPSVLGVASHRKMQSILFLPVAASSDTWMNFGVPLVASWHPGTWLRWSLDVLICGQHLATLLPPWWRSFVDVSEKEGGRLKRSLRPCEAIPRGRTAGA